MKRTEEELKKFGLTMATAFVVLAAIVLWRGRPWGVYLLYVAAVFLVLEVFVPRALGPVERVWLAFGERLGAVMTIIILTIAYFIAITPMALLLWMLRKDLLHLRLDPAKTSYWEPVEPDGPHSRPFLPY